MTIELKPEQQRTLDLAIQSGAYHDPDEVLAHAFEIIEEQLRFEDWMADRREELASQIAVGFAQAERGDSVDSAEAIAMLRRRRAERLKQEGRLLRSSSLRRPWRTSTVYGGSSPSAAKMLPTGWKQRLLPRVIGSLGTRCWDTNAPTSHLWPCVSGLFPNSRTT